MTEVLTVDFIAVLAMAVLALVLIFRWGTGATGEPEHPKSDEPPAARSWRPAPALESGSPCEVYAGGGVATCPLRRGDAGGSCVSCSFYRPA